MDPRLTKQELAAINASAVTRNYSVEPRLGNLQPYLKIIGRFLESTALLSF